MVKRQTGGTGTEHTGCAAQAEPKNPYDLF